MKRSLINFFALLAVIWIGAGCATTPTIASRKQERAAAYAALNPEFKAAVDQGQIKAGMDTDAVYISWGHPSQQVTGGNQMGESTTWIYQAGYIQQQRYWGSYRVHYIDTPMTYTRAQVTFVNGRVAQWQVYASPDN